MKRQDGGRQRACRRWKGGGRGWAAGAAMAVVALSAWFVAPAASPALAASARRSATRAVSARSHDSKTKKKADLTYYFVSHGCPQTTFWGAVWNGAKAAGKQFGVNVKILKLTTAECTSVSAVVTLFSTAIAGHPNGIVVTVESPTAFSSSLKTATHDGIPVVVMNTAPTNTGKPTATNPYLAYIGEDNYTAGAEAATEAVKLFHLTSGAGVAIIDFEPNNVSPTARSKGAESVLKPKGITPAVINTVTTVSAGTTVVSAYLTAHKTIKCILGLGPTGVSQAVDAIEADNLSGIDIGGFDLTSTVLNYLKKGEVGFTLDQQPYLQGYDSIMELYLDSTVGAAPVTIYTGPAYLTKGNVGKLAKYVTLTGY